MSKVANPDEVVYSYMKAQNRPYSANDVFLNLQKKIGKTQIIKSMEKLAVDSKLVEKVYGKSKIYVINQEEFGAMADGFIQELQLQVKTKSEQIKLKKERLKEVKMALSKYAKTISPKEIEIKIQKTKDNIKKMNDNIALAKTKANGIEAGTLTTTVSRVKDLAKTWKTRKRMCEDMMDQVLESYPKPKKVFIEETDVTVDEHTDKIPKY